MLGKVYADEGVEQGRAALRDFAAHPATAHHLADKLARQPSALLSSMRDVSVMEERANGKINVPDIFRVEADILRKGGVAVPKRTN